MAWIRSNKTHSLVSNGTLARITFEACLLKYASDPNEPLRTGDRMALNPIWDDLRMNLERILNHKINIIPTKDWNYVNILSEKEVLVTFEMPRCFRYYREQQGLIHAA